MHHINVLPLPTLRRLKGHHRGHGALHLLGASLLDEMKSLVMGPGSSQIIKQDMDLEHVRKKTNKKKTVQTSRINMFLLFLDCSMDVHVLST